MAKNKKRKKTRPTGDQAKPSKGWKVAGVQIRGTHILNGVVVILLIGAGVSYFLSQQDEEAFLKLAEQGKPKLTDVKTFPSEGRTHIPDTRPTRYNTDPPTSGPHYLTWIDPGIYDETKPAGNLVHSLEHGMIVIYRDEPDAKTSELLETWAGLYKGPWSGIVLLKKPGLGKKVILTAWQRILRLDSFDAAAAAAFIDAYRGRGPENPVR